MKNSLLFLGMLVCFGSYGYAQCSASSHVADGYNGTETSFTNFASVGKGLGQQFNRALFVSNVNSKQSVYLLNSWNNKATVYFNGNKITFDNVNFNLKENRLEILLKDNTVYAVNPSDYDKVVIGSKIYIGGKNKTSIQEKVAKLDNAIIVKEFKLKVKKGRVNALTQVKETSDKNYISESYFKIEDGKRKKINSKKALSYKPSKKRVVKGITPTLASNEK